MNAVAIFAAIGCGTVIWWTGKLADRIANHWEERRSDKRIVREGANRGAGGVSTVELHALIGDDAYVIRYLEAIRRRDSDHKEPS